MVSLEPGVGGLKWDLPSPTVRCFIGTPKVARSISIRKVPSNSYNTKTKFITLVHRHMDTRSNILSELEPHKRTGPNRGKRLCMHRSEERELWLLQITTLRCMRLLALPLPCGEGLE